ncbi:MAG: hypothetical protein WBB28_21155 [Crinalium sp.]
MPRPKSTGTGIKKRNQQVNQSEPVNLPENEVSDQEEVNQSELVNSTEDEPINLTKDDVSDLTEDEPVNLVEVEPVNLLEDEVGDEDVLNQDDSSNLLDYENSDGLEVTEGLSTLNDDSNHDGKDTEILENIVVEDAVMENTVVQQQSTDAKVKAIKRIHFVDGEKGGVGKSLFCRVLLEYCNSRGYLDRIHFVESDVSNPDVGRIYFTDEEGKKTYTEAEFTSEDKKDSSADVVLELATKKSVIVNLPSNIYSSVTAWFERNDIFALAKEKNIQIIKWFVCNGGDASLEKFKDSVNDPKIQDITHIFVRNQVIFDNWEFLNEDEDLTEILKRENVFQMDFPQFSFGERNRLDKNRLTFSKALADDSGFTILGKQRIKKFLNTTYEGIERLKLVP